MMRKWLVKLFGKKAQTTRKRVQIDIPMQQHRYRLEDFNIVPPAAADKEDSKDS